MATQLGASVAATARDGPGLWPTEVARLYGLDSTADAPGECVGIVALGGGYLPGDVAKACEGMNRPVPLVVDSAVSGTGNMFSGGDEADQEIALDMQILAGLVPSVRIVVYFCGNNVTQLGDAICHATFDDVNRPRVLSISWGSAEAFWKPPVRDSVESALAEAAARGITVVAAAGDLLATAGLQDNSAHVLYPASSPQVLACGGTQLTLDATGAALVEEEAWHENWIGTGGGISDIFDLPDYQKSVRLPPSVNDGKMRLGIPDVAAAAGRKPGYRIILNGEPKAMPGTSAAAPFWAALIAMANARRGAPLGSIHSFLYANPTLCRPIIRGDNRLDGIGYDAGPGWNACAGLGVPNNRTVDGLTSMPSSIARQELPHVT